MNILYIANARIPTEKAHGVQIMKACEAFVRAGNELELLIPNRKNPIQEDPFSYYNIKTTFPIKKLFTFDTIGWGSFGYIFQSVLFGLFAQFHIWNYRELDIVYGRDEIVLSVIGLLTNKKIFWESHDGSWNKWARYLVRRAAGVVVVTSGAIDFYTEHGVPRGRLLAVSNGIDLEDFAYPESKEEARRRLHLPLDKNIALYIGRLDGWKGAETLLKASELLPDFIRVVVIGGEKEQIDGLFINYPKVIFLGYRPYAELSNNQAAADVLIVPNTGKNEISMRFTSPLKLIAHMASHRPLVVSDLPTTRWIADGAAFFVSPDDPNALARGIQYVFSNPHHADGLVKIAEERVKVFSWSKRAGRILDFLMGKNYGLD